MSFKHAALVVCLLGVLEQPGYAADASKAPPAPDYAQAVAWAAWPGRPGAVNTVAPGLPDAAVPVEQKVDVFFIHPTTYLTGSAPNARYDEPGMSASQIEQGVMRFQASVFNACCRIYAPRYRQAALRAFRGSSDAEAAAAFELAYSDVRRAFDHYLEHENQGRPFIIASHSQGSLHALRLVQERLAGKPLQRQLVAAYIIGYPMPLAIEQSGLPICRSASQTGCLIDWNTVKEDTAEGAREQARLVWLEERYQRVGQRPLVCVNPLNWSLGGQAAANANLGSLPGVRPGEALEPPVPALTGARCTGGRLEVSIPVGQRSGFANLLTFFGSYHILDYNLFYVNLRVNAQQRVLAYQAARRTR
jgi:Protein of unknown function (DUF3089)